MTQSSTQGPAALTSKGESLIPNKDAAGSSFTAKDGAVFWRGSYKSPDDCGRLLDYLRSDKPECAWQAALNNRLARDLENAMAKAYHMDIAA